MLYINKYRKEIDEILGTDNDVLKYTETGEPPLKLFYEKENIGDDFYNIIEKKIKSFKDSGLTEADMYDKIWSSLKDHLQHFKGDLIIREIRNLINAIEKIESKNK